MVEKIGNSTKNSLNLDLNSQNNPPRMAIVESLPLRHESRISVKLLCVDLGLAIFAHSEIDRVGHKGPETDSVVGFLASQFVGPLLKM